MSDAKPPTVVDLQWNGDLTFTARAGSHAWVIDGRNEAAPSPMVALASALAGCMAVDIVHILTRGRFDVRSFSTKLTGRRAESEPRRFVAIDLRYAIDTNAPPDQITRALALSREKYCSVWHSMSQDIELTAGIVNAPSVSQPESHPTLTPR